MWRDAVSAPCIRKAVQREIKGEEMEREREREREKERERSDIKVFCT